MSDERKYEVPRPQIIDQLVDEMLAFLQRRTDELNANLAEAHSAAFSVAVRVSRSVITRTGQDIAAKHINRFNIAKRYADVADDLTITGTSIH